VLARNEESGVTRERVVEVLEGGGFTDAFEKRMAGRKPAPPPLDLSEL
jgi:hypothetical protein